MEPGNRLEGDAGMPERMIDLSLDIYHGAPTFAYDPKCAVIIHNTVETIGYNITQISLSTQQGTHLDAPFHFFNDGITVDKLPLEAMIGPAFKIDMTHKPPKEKLTVADFLPYESRIREGAKIIYYTGWDKRFPDKSYFTDFPYLSIELADWLAGRRIALLGMDAPTPNPAGWLEVHRSLLGHGVILLEGLANVDRIEKDEFYLVVAPLKITGRDGSPVRAVAIEGRERRDDDAGSAG
jgi:arylformamidase